MRVAVAGGHGQIAQQILKQLAEQGHEGVGLIRNPEHAADLLLVGGIPAVVDLEQVDAATLAKDLVGVDAVVFAAGGGPDSGPERKLTIDRDGAIKLADAAEQAGVGRYVMISAMAADDFDADSDDIFQIYLRAKSEADAAVRSRQLDWTIIRPGGLTNNEGNGKVQLAESTGRGSIPRADVAALVVSCLVDGHGVHSQFEAISGDNAIADALATLG